MQSNQNSKRAGTKRVRITISEIKKLPKAYQHEIMGAIRIIEIQRQQSA